MLKTIPLSQLQAMKLIVNHAYEQQGLNAVQTLGPILDGMMRNTPDALAWVDKVESRRRSESAIIQRDGPFGDYSQAPSDRKPDPNHVVSH